MLLVRAPERLSTCEKASLQIAGARCSYAQIVSTACPPARRRVWPRPGRRRSTVVAVRVVECAVLIAADLFTYVEQTRRRITFSDVERHLAELGSHHHGCSCGRCALVSPVNAQRVYAIASGGRPSLAHLPEKTGVVQVGEPSTGKCRRKPRKLRVLP